MICTLEELRLQLRLDDDDHAEDALLLGYAEAAEQWVFTTIERTEEEMLALYGGIPKPIKQSVLLLAADWFANREAGRSPSAGSIAAGLSFLLMPFKKL